MGVDRPLGRAGAAAGEQDRRRIILRYTLGDNVPRLARFRAASPPRAARRRAGSRRESTAVPRDTTIRRRTVSRPQPRSRLPRIAFGMPMKTSGAASRQHCPRLRRPIPGSISTGTMPALKTAKTRAKKSSPGGTISTARVPGTIPIARRPSAISSLSSSSRAIGHPIVTDAGRSVSPRRDQHGERFGLLPSSSR